MYIHQHVPCSGSCYSSISYLCSGARVRVSNHFHVDVHVHVNINCYVHVHVNVLLSSYTMMEFADSLSLAVLKGTVSRDFLPDVFSDRSNRFQLLVNKHQET
jgi:hypothetical protein